jgi:SAM-dependent methyltransferase
MVPGPRSARSRWTPRTVAWYERANARSDYAATVLSTAAPVLPGARSVLDVGAGFGALALPLAARVDRITALEPAPAMRAALRRALRRRGVVNVRVVPAAWGERPLPPHDVTVCAHVGPLLAPGSPFLAALPALGRLGFVLVHDAPGGGDKFFFSELYPRLLGRPYGSGRAPRDALAALTALGIAPRVRTVDVSSDQPLSSLTEACDFWMTHMGLTDVAARRFLRRFLAPRLRREGRAWIAPYRKRVSVITWRR